MKILTVRSTLPAMGPGTQPLAIARQMRERGHETVLATAGGEYTPEYLKAGFPVTIIPGLSPHKHNLFSIANAVLALARLIRRERPDVVHGHNAAATLCAYTAGVLAGRRLPCVTSVRGVEERTTHQWRNAIWKRLPGILLAVCENTKQRLLAFGCQSRKIVVTYNGLDLSRFDPSKHDGEAVKVELGLSGRIVVGTIGAMTGPEELEGPGKGQHILVRAAALVQKDIPELAVLMVGDGPARSKVEAVVEELGMHDHVVFAGSRFDVPRMLSAMDLYCLASINGEFFPNTIVEAMAMRLPWVGSDIAGLSELTANREAGWISSVGDVEALASHVRRLAADPALRRERGMRGRREVEDRFTIDQVVNRILSGYRSAGCAEAT